MARKSDFSALVQSGENTNGFRSQNPNGVGRGGIGGDYEEQLQFAESVNGRPWSQPVDDMFGGAVAVRKSRR